MARSRSRSLTGERTDFTCPGSYRIRDQIASSRAPESPLADLHRVSLVDQGGRLKRLAGLLPGKVLSGQLPQLVVDQGEELLGRPGVALLDGGEEPAHVVHGSGFPEPPRRIPEPGPGSVAQCRLRP